MSEPESPSTAAIRFDRVGVLFDDGPVLRDIDLVLTERRIALLGPNGSGKTTLARLVNGLVRPTTGRVLVDGLDTRTELKAVRGRVGFVFQDPDNQIVLPIVEEDVAFGLRNRGLARAEAERRARAALAGYGLAALAGRPVHTLSGGEKQLVALIGVLVMEPAIVVLDEPTTMLDLRNRNRVAAAIRALPQRVLVVTHDLDLPAGFDRAIVMNEGRVMADDRPAAAVARYRALVG